MVCFRLRTSFDAAQSSTEEGSAELTVSAVSAYAAVAPPIFLVGHEVQHLHHIGGDF